jgi:hypothetical protein
MRQLSTKGRSKYKGGKTDVSAVLTINLGYRSLIDWVHSPRWTESYVGPAGSPDVTYEPPGTFSDMQGGGLDSAPSMWKGSTQNAPRANPGSGNVKLPGDIGAAFDVANPNVPSLAGGAAGLAGAFGNHVPQWLYRMAEIMKWNNAMSKSELKQIANAKKIHPYPLKEGEGITNEIRRGLRSKENPEGSLIVDRPVPQKAQNLQNAWQRLPRFAAGAKNKNYARTFSESVYANMPSSISRQFGILKQTMMDRFDVAGSKYSVQQAMGDVIVNSDQPGKEGVMGAMGRGQGGFKGEEITETSGSTYQEKMVEVMGIGTSPEDTEVSVFGGWRTVDPDGKNFGSRSIDVKFREQAIKGRPEIQGTRADLTTQTYQDSYQHGIGKTGVQADTSIQGITTKQQERITRYNDVIQILKSLYDETDVRKLRRKIAYEQVPYGSELKKKAPSGTGYKTSTQLRNEVMSAFQGVTEDSINTEIFREWDETMQFILHAMGTHIANDPWANIMSIKLKDKEGTEYNGTLIINYTQNNDGYFQDLQPGDVAVLEYSTEEWLWRVGVDAGSELTLEEALNRANESFAVEGYEQGAVLGGLTRIQSGSVGHQTAHMRMPIPGALSGVMDQYTTEIILNMAKGLETEMRNDMVAEATTFSRSARSKANMGDIPSWMDAIGKAFLSDSSGDEFGRGYSSRDPGAIAGGDDFYQNTSLWFLWAAPYISTYYPKKGGAEQYRGSGKPRGA